MLFVFDIEKGSMKRRKRERRLLLSLTLILCCMSLPFNEYFILCHTLFYCSNQIYMVWAHLPANSDLFHSVEM